MWQLYTGGKQTYRQLGELYGLCVKTIQRRLDKVKAEKPSLEKGKVVVLMDTTYFGRTFGVMLFKDAHSGKNLYKQYVKNETNSLYEAGLLFLMGAGLGIEAVVCDGRKGLLSLFPNIPKQMCQFHQVAIIPLPHAQTQADGKSHYTHKKLRSAYRSLKTNLPWLFTWYDKIDLKIPNTTNAIDGHFADLKNKLRNHNGLSLARKKKFIDEFLKA